MLFHNRQSTRNTFRPNSTITLPCARSPSTLSIFVPTVSHGHVFIQLIDILVCTIKNNQTLNALNMSHNIILFPGGIFGTMIFLYLMACSTHDHISEELEPNKCIVQGQICIV